MTPLFNVQCKANNEVMIDWPGWPRACMLFVHVNVIDMGPEVKFRC